MANYYYSDHGFEGEEEKTCSVCHGSGEDRDGADCIPCGGMGSVYIR